MKRLFALLALMLPLAAEAETPVACTAFAPVLSCNAATGEPVVTLTNTLSGSFDPDQVRISSLSEGVVAIPNPANPLALQLTGARAGQTVLLNLAAIATGAGSAEGLDKCCRGDVSVNIPTGFACEVPQELSLSQVCTADPAGADALDVLCEITLHYAGAAPTASDPLLLSDTPSGAGWSPVGVVLASDAWVCSEAVAGSPIACHLDESLEPLADWRDFSTTLALAFRTPASFENCVAASAGGRTAKACWSTDLPRLHIAKFAPEACAPGAVCSFELDVSNPGSVAYEGPLSIEDGFRRSTPPTAGLGEFIAIDPPLCAVADLNAGLCAGTVSLASGATQRYRIDWSAPDLGASYSALNCARVVSLAGTGVGDDEPFGGIEGLACAEAHVVAGATRGGEAPKPPAQGNVSLHLVKTAEPCTTNVAAQTYNCPFTLTLNNSGDVDFIGPLAVNDSFGEAKPKAIATTDPDWTCAQTDQGAMCDTPQISLAAQASFALPVSLTLRGLPEGGSLTNCAGLGLPEMGDTVGPESVALVQRILLLQGQPIGSADGKMGAKTRAAVAELQADLGLDASGGIDAALLAKLLDLKAFAPEPQSCVTVDLSPMPAPPLVCDRATAVKASGACQCRFDGMVRAGKTACGCAKGSSFVAGKGCVKSKTPTKNPPKTQPKTPTKPQAQQPNLRICPNGLPEIPGIGCVNIDILKKRGGKAAGSGCVDPSGLQCG